MKCSIRYFWKKMFGKLEKFWKKFWKKLTAGGRDLMQGTFGKRGDLITPLSSKFSCFLFNIIF
jgi:hypothetical protein